VTFVVRRRRAGRHQPECKHNGRNNGYDCFHCDPSCKAMPAISLLLLNHHPPQWVQYILYLLSRAVGSRSQTWRRQSSFADVRFGSKAYICAAKRHVCFTPESGHFFWLMGCVLRANIVIQAMHNA
jgi:hypothetical protein